MRQSFALRLSRSGPCALGSLRRGHAPEWKSLPEGLAGEELAEKAARELGDLGYRGEPLVVTLPAESLMPATLLSKDLPQKSRHRALLYLLEEKLPLAAESVVCDFLSRGDETFCLAAELEPLRSIVDPLEERGVHIECIAPESFLTPPPVDLDAAVTASGNAAEVTLFQSGFPLSQKRCEIKPTEILSEIERHPAFGERRLKVELGGAAAELRFEVTSDIEFSPPRAPAPEKDAEISQRAREIASGKAKPLFDFRRGALAPRQWLERLRFDLRVFCAAFMLCLVSLSGSLYYQGAKYEKVVKEKRSELRGEFEKVFPQERAPISILRRLESKLRELKGLSAETDGKPRAKRPPSALSSLAACLSALPEGQRYRLLDLRVLPDQILLRGQARTHSAANRISKSLERVVGFEVDPPSTENLEERGVSFLIRLTKLEGGTS